MLIRNEPKTSVIEEALIGYATGWFQRQAEVVRVLEDHPGFPISLQNRKLSYHSSKVSQRKNFTHFQ
jgi:hypothetical protein